MAETKEKEKPKKQAGPVKYQLKMLRGHGKFNTGEVAVFDEEKAQQLLDDRRGGPFAELVQVMED